MAPKAPRSTRYKIAAAVLAVAGIILGIGWERAFRTGAPPPAWALILFFPALVATFFLAQGALAQDNGWSALALKYRAPRSRSHGRSFSRQVTRIGGIQEGGITCLVVADEGLFLCAVWLFRYRRPPLLIPWKEIAWVRESRDFPFRTWELDLGGITTIRIRRKAYEHLKSFVPAPSLARARAGQPPPPIE
jgi:hypothetical protein